MARSRSWSTCSTHARCKTPSPATPDAIVHQATALAELSDFKHFDRSFGQTNALRTKGTDALLAAARATGVRRFVAQSYACHRYAREGGPVKTEADPLDATPVSAMRETVDAMRYLDETVTAAGGIALVSLDLSIQWLSLPLPSYRISNNRTRPPSPGSPNHYRRSLTACTRFLTNRQLSCCPR
ncbi:MAG: hypothetical protein WBP81_35530 [Solirubrobacteraceae bacterium]